MIVVNDEHVTLGTPTGPMRTHIVRPAAPGRYPGIAFYSEIFQITAPIRRTVAYACRTRLHRSNAGDLSRVPCAWDRPRL